MRTTIPITTQGLLALLVCACTDTDRSANGSTNGSGAGTSGGGVGVSTGENTSAGTGEHTSASTGENTGGTNTGGSDGDAEVSCDPTKPRGFQPMAAPPSLDAMGLMSTWTGTEVIVSPQCTGAPGAAISAYAPATDTWRELPTAPLAMHARLVWSGSEAIFFGPFACTNQPLTSDGMAYDPVADTWRIMPMSPPGHWGASSLIWSTSTDEMILWGGGYGEGDAWYAVAEGAAYHPATDTWRMIAPSPLAARSSHGAVWDGTRMVVFGGDDNCVMFSDAAAYDPAADARTSISLPPGTSARHVVKGIATGPNRELATFFGGYADCPFDESDYPVADGFTYDVATGSFTAIPSAGQVLPVPDRVRPALWWGAGRLWYWGGEQEVPLSPRGASYDPASGSWSAMPPDDLPNTTVGTVAWTGCEAVLGVGKVVDSNWEVTWSLFRP